MSEQTGVFGGSFLVQETAPEDVFIPEQLSAEARLMGRTMDDFLRKEVLPVIPRLEAKEDGLMRSLLQKAGALGLLAGGISEAHGGLELPKTALTLLAEKAAPYLSFAIALSVHSGVATLPLMFFGTPEQKAKYLPQLAFGESIGAFALSEANSGSDALGAQARATLSSDGSAYILNGEKMWITNSAFADVFTVFAKVNGEQFTAFLVERDTPGLSVGPEEHKMGLHGSSTRRLILNDARVPVDCVLGEVGKGHYSALYALNVGRFSIGVTALGAAKECLRLAAVYAKQRVQFGQPIANFDLIRHKLADMAARIFVLESMVYRVAGWFDAPADSNNDGMAYEAKFRALSEEYAIECAIIKFFGTEVLAFAADEALQIHGGFGYSEEFAVARMYRDARIFRIFEGTNEINRLAVLDQFLRREAKGRLSLAPPVAEIEAWYAPPEVEDKFGNIRGHILKTLQAAREADSDGLKSNQLFAADFADECARLFADESAWLRACRMRLHGDNSELAEAAQRLYLYQSARRQIRMQDETQCTEHLAAAVLAKEGYPF